MPPTFPSTAIYARLSLGFTDNSGNFTSVAYRVPITTTAAQGLAFATAKGNASSANLYSVELALVFEAPALASSALDGEQNSVYDRMNIMFRREADNVALPVSLPAPLEAIMVDDTDNLNAASPLYVAIRDAFADIHTANPIVPSKARYTERRKIGKRRPAF